MPLNIMTDRRASHRHALERNLSTLAVAFISNCNLACKMCSQVKDREHSVAYDRALSIMDEARTLGADRFSPCGGEIFTRKDIIDIMTYAERIGFQQISVVSNGTLLLEGQKIKQLEKLSTLLITISVDGPREVHDDLRGKGVYDKAVEALRELRARGITASISSVIMRQTIDRLKEIVDLAVDLGVPVISMQPYNRETAGMDNDHAAFEFRPDEETSLRKKLRDILHYAASKNIVVYTANMMDRVPPYLTRRIRPIPPDGCFVPSRLLLVDTSGETYPCFMMQRVMKEKSMGNVHDKSLDNIWHNDIHRELTLMGLNRECPRCFAACSDVDGYNSGANRDRVTKLIRRVINRFI